MPATGRRRLVLRARAKINLDHRVGDRRADGTHEVRTVLQTIGLSDTLTFERRPGPLVLRCQPPVVPADETNLVWRAASALWDAANRQGPPRDVAIGLTKRIPSQAGLGGGSADAAVTLAALNRLWRTGLRDGDLRPVAAGLGADVPFFLSGGTALGLGRGDEVYPLADLPRLWVAVLVPAVGVATADAYGWLDRRREAAGAREPSPQPIGPEPWASVIQLINDLEAPVVAHHPVIARIKRQLLAGGALGAAMSGSGSAVCGLFARRRDAAAAAAMARAGWRTFVTRTVSRQEYLAGLRG